MTQRKHLTVGNSHSVSLLIRMMQGAGIGLVLIVSIIMRVKHPHPAWGHNWTLRPLITMPMAGAAGAIFFYLTDDLREQGGWKKTWAIITSCIAFIIALWMGIVLGLDGTLWN